MLDGCGLRCRLKNVEASQGMRRFPGEVIELILLHECTVDMHGSSLAVPVRKLVL